MTDADRGSDAPAAAPTAAVRARGGRELARASFENATRYFVISTSVVLAVTIVGIPFALIVVPIVYIAKTIEYKHIECVLHERALRVKRGWLNKTEQTIPLEKITDVAIRQGPIMRYCEVEALSVETAGQSGPAGGSLVTLVGVRDARGFRDQVLERRDRLAGWSDEEEGPASDAAPAASSTSGAAGGGESLAVLKAIAETLTRIERKLDERTPDERR